MRKHFIVMAILTLVCVSAGAFPKREHSTVAFIAEKYLTPKASRAVNTILKGEKMAAYASYPDNYRKTLFRDGKDVPHTFHISDDLNSLTGPESSAVSILNDAIKELKDWKNLDEQRCLEDLVLVIHLTGDIHCPSHFRESSESANTRPTGYKLNGAATPFHRAWDSMFLEYIFSGGFYDLAFMADIATPKQRAEYQKGTPEDWAIENAQLSYPVIHDIDVSENREVTITRQYVMEHAFHAKNQIMKAGYRLAKLLNETFK